MENNNIIIFEAATERDVERFWTELHNYLRRDMFPDSGEGDVERYLSNQAYQNQVQQVHDRERDRCHYLFFRRNGQEIGFALPVIYDSEDDKCFVLDFCVYPEFRGNGTGTACTQALLKWAKEHGAAYAELSYGEDARRLRFWRRVGFLPNGANEWGDLLLTYPPEEELPITVERLTAPEDWQLCKLENGYLLEVGESLLSDDRKARLQDAVRTGQITFFFAKRGYRAVGMCSVARHFSTFSCAMVGVFDDFFVEPVFRRKGIARKLAQAAQCWCAENGIASLSVCSASCDEEMYQALGFVTRLGSTYTVMME